MKLTHILIAAGCMAAAHSAHASEKYRSIAELQENGSISVQILSTGGYSGNCVNLQMKNNRSDTQFVWIEAGRRLDNPVETDQDILLVREEKIALPPFAKTQRLLFGFCCQASNGAPKTDTTFRIGSMAGGNLEWLAGFIDHKKYDTYTIQQAVWVFSDNHQLASVVAGRDPLIIDLRKAMAKKLNITLPWYDIQYRTVDNTPFSGQHTRVTGEIEFSSASAGFLSINIRNEVGMLMHVVTEEENALYGSTYTVPLNIPVEHWGKGRYSVNVYIDGNLKKKQEFVL
ncbi:MAG: hypothetical protein IBJ09_14425 [Bacteroidia bacterium]|nr:hypothetical protein [Bacteroidia bacterium]